MRFRALGPLVVVDAGGRSVDVGGSQPRTVLATLLAAEGQVVRADALVDAVWRDDPPASAGATLQSYVSRLRRRLADAGALLHEAGGYRLDVSADDVDFRRFEADVRAARALLDDGRVADARAGLADALALWRGEAFADFPDVEPILGPARRLSELRLAALDERIRADLALGRHAVVIGELTELVAAHPFRESLHGHLALALYRSGRQADALRALDAARRTLVDELGVDPGSALRELETAILRQDAALELTSRPAASPVTVASPAPPPAPGPRLVGRDAELAELHAALDEAVGATVVAVLEGPPGIGKTRLAQEVAAAGARRGAVVLWGATFEGGAAPAYWPWLPPLRALAAARDGDGPLPPALAGVLHPAGSDDRPSELIRFSLADEVADLLAASAARHPLVLVIDDLQWADAASLDLLAAVTARLVHVPVLVVCTTRDVTPAHESALVDALAALARRPGSRRLRLDGLSATATAELVEAMTGRRPDDATVDAVHRRAEGNPFCTTEMARLLATGDALDAVPAGVRDVVRHRLGQLPPGSVELLQVAAVVGGEADVELLAAVSDRALDACLGQLEPAIEHRLLEEVEDRPGALVFVHALVREVVVEDLSPLRRARLHLRVAEALPATDDTAEIVAEHLWRAASIAGGRRAAEALERAAGVAIRRLAYVVADDLLERAVRLRQTTRGGDDAAACELDALLRLVVVRGARLGYPGVVGTPAFARAKELAERLGRRGEVMALLWIEWASADLARDVARSEVVAPELLARATASGAPAELVVGHTAVGIANWHRGRFGLAAHHLDEACRAIPLVRAAEPGLHTFGADPLRLAAPFAVYVHELIGDRSDDELDAGYGAAIALHGDDPLWEIVVLSFAASAAISTGRPDRTLRWTERALDAEPGGVPTYWRGMIRAFHGAARCLAGELDEGLHVLDDALAAYHGTGLHANDATWLACRAHGLALAGRVEEAAASLAEAQRQVHMAADEFAASTVLLAEARVRHARRDAAPEVRRALVAAVDTATSQGAPAMAARARRDAAELGVSIE